MVPSEELIPTKSPDGKAHPRAPAASGLVGSLARAIAAAREFTPSLTRMAETLFRTALSLSTRRAATCAFVSPVAIRSSTSCSRAESCGKGEPAGAVRCREK